MAEALAFAPFPRSAGERALARELLVLRFMRSIPWLLVVSVRPSILRTLEVLLEDEGHFRVGVALSAEEALSMLSVERRFRAVIADVDLPSFNGLDLLVAMRARFPRLPVVVVVPAAASALAERARLLGASGVVAEPLEPERLVRSLRRLRPREPYAP